MDICAVIWVVPSQQRFNCFTSGICQVYPSWDQCHKCSPLGSVQHDTVWSHGFTWVLTPRTYVPVVKASSFYLRLHVILSSAPSPLPLSRVLPRVSSWLTSLGQWKQRPRSQSAWLLVSSPLSCPIKAVSQRRLHFIWSWISQQLTIFGYINLITGLFKEQTRQYMSVIL